MADEQYRWLDRETAERLLSGEPPEAVDGAHRGEAERLARTLDALSASPPPTSEELPGEAAALAAFRKARAERADAAADSAAPARASAAGAADAGLVRIGTARGTGPGGARRSRRFRPARLALAASLAVGMAGGVAAVAATGVLGTPFGGDESDPGSSASATVTPPERPLVSPSPTGGGQGGAAPGDDAPNSAATGGTGDSGEGTREDTAGKPGTGADRPGSHAEITEACRDLRAGLRLDDDRRSALRDAAGDTRVWTFCKGVLAQADPRSGASEGEDGGGAGGTGEGRQGQGQGGDKNGKSDKNGASDKNGKSDTNGASDENESRGRDGGQGRGEGERKAGRKGGQTAGEKKADVGGDHVWRSVAPLRPAVSYSVKISPTRV
ncbi:hypothetical protein ACFVOR_02110 [Streptomyces sp. NPDC057837]|uniref:hypothetical protein n=1 Tax=Streptomyces sp. NPDC057837 TaxID=3346260 RepID=UPI0036BDEB1A